MTSIFDSEQFGWPDLSVQIGGRVVAGLRGIRYAEKQEMEYIYGAGNKPLAIAEGNITYEGEVKLLQSELEQLIKLAPGGRLQRLTSQITITYNKDQVLVTDILTGVRFNEVDKSFDQNGKQMEISLPFMCLDLKLNV